TLVALEIDGALLQAVLPLDHALRCQARRIKAAPGDPVEQGLVAGHAVELGAVAVFRVGLESQPADARLVAALQPVVEREGARQPGAVDRRRAAGVARGAADQAGLRRA